MQTFDHLILPARDAFPRYRQSPAGAIASPAGPRPQFDRRLRSLADRTFYNAAQPCFPLTGCVTEREAFIGCAWLQIARFGPASFPGSTCYYEWSIDRGCPTMSDEQASSTVVTLDAKAIPAIPDVGRLSVSRQKLTKVDWRNKLFRDFNARNAEFEDCDFRYAIFERAYFRDTKFTNCRFDGAQILRV